MWAGDWDLAGEQGRSILRGVGRRWRRRSWNKDGPSCTPASSVSPASSRAPPIPSSPPPTTWPSSRTMPFSLFCFFPHPPPKFQFHQCRLLLYVIDHRGGDQLLVFLFLNRIDRCLGRYFCLISLKFVVCRVVYNMCTQNPPRDYSQQLYDGYALAIEEYILLKVCYFSFFFLIFLT